MLIPLNLPHVFEPTSDTADNAMALRALLECLITLNLAYRATHTVRPLYQSGVVYGRTVSWDTVPALYRKGYGDCKSLSAALIAEYRASGIVAKPEFRWVPRGFPRVTNGVPRDFHILVRTPAGREDPSKRLGMGRNENAPYGY